MIDEKMWTLVKIVVPATLLFLALILYSIRRNVKATEGEYNHTNPRTFLKIYFEELGKEYRKKIPVEHFFFNRSLIVLLMSAICFVASFYLNGSIYFILGFFLLFIYIVLASISDTIDTLNRSTRNKNAFKATAQRVNTKETKYLAKNQETLAFYFILFILILGYIIMEFTQFEL
jgi:ABC-type multidrug transport system fused ATPase/permease subunit